MYDHPRDGGFLIVNVTESQSSAIRLEMLKMLKMWRTV